MNAIDIVQKMLDNDPFSRWFGVEVIDLSEGFCKLEMRVREEMTNGFGIAHGGITYSFADSAFAFASNSRGMKAVSNETVISHLKPVYPDDILIATASEVNLTRRTGLYEVVIRNQKNEMVAHFRGTVHRTDKPWTEND